MIKRFAPLIILVLLASAVFGWLRAGTSAGPQPAAVDGWDSLQYASPSKRDYELMAAQVKTSSLLPLSFIAETKAKNSVDAANLGPTDTPPFPKVLSATILNKTAYVILSGPELSDSEAKNIRVKTGDVLESGWEITSIDKKRVLARFKDQEIDVPIVAYLQTAFEKAEEDAMDTADTDNMSPNNTPGGGE